MIELIEPKTHPVKMPDGTERTFVLSKFPAIAGREIIALYPVTNIPKVGEYQQSEEIMLKLMAYVAVQPAGGSDPIRLTTAALVNNHVGDALTLMGLEAAMLDYNFGFFARGKLSGFLESFTPKVATWITQTLIPLLGASLQTGKPHGTN